MVILNSGGSLEGTIQTKRKGCAEERIQGRVLAQDAVRHMNGDGQFYVFAWSRRWVTEAMDGLVESGKHSLALVSVASSHGVAPGPRPNSGVDSGAESGGSLLARIVWG
jgi:hypothetical protein